MVWLIVLTIFFGALLVEFIPIIFVGMFFYGIYKFLTQQRLSRRENAVREASEHLSNAQRKKIDKKLKAYFKDNYALSVYEDIALITANGEYSEIERLQLCCNGEVIMSLDEFKTSYPVMFDRICDLLLKFADYSDEVLKAEVKNENIKTEKAKKLSDAQKYIDKINNLNSLIPNEEITNGLYQTCALLKQIDLGSEKQENKSGMTKLYDYYMPMLVSILENYRKLQDNDSQSEEFKKQEAHLIKTIILINEALKAINESLYETDYMNLSADMTTLQSLLKQDGYGNNPFGGKK